MNKINKVDPHSFQPISGSQGSKTGDVSPDIITFNTKNIKESGSITALKIGRAADNAIQIGANCNTIQSLSQNGISKISSNHAEMIIDTSNGTLKVNDFNSTNGTSVRLRTSTKSFKNPKNDNYTQNAAPYEHDYRESDGSVTGRFKLDPSEPFHLDLRDEWEIILAPRSHNNSYANDSLVIKSDGSGNLTVHQIDPDTNKPGDAVSDFKLSFKIPQAISPELANAATNSAKVSLLNPDFPKDPEFINPDFPKDPEFINPDFPKDPEFINPDEKNSIYN